MKFTMEIDTKTNTVAFGDKPIQHLSGVLIGIANTIAFIGNIENTKPIETPIYDVNGSECGTWSLTED